MAKLYQSPICLAVLNPKGRDPFVDYENGITGFDPDVHAPVNFHAYAAATHGVFCDSVDQVIQHRSRIDAVLVLIRKRTWITLDAVRELQGAGMKVIVAWKECGPMQISRQLSSLKAFRAYQEILKIADGILSPTQVLPPGGGLTGYTGFWEKVKFIPTPYPIEHEDWDYSGSLSRKKGIMVGTREFDTATRNHLNAISWMASLAHEMDISRVTVINSEKSKGMKKLSELAGLFPDNCLQIVEKRLSYLDYMELLARHRFVFQMDRSGVPGQVAGDCLLAGILCAGGDSTIEQLAFPSLCDDGSLHLHSVFENIRKMMGDDEAYENALRQSQEIARKELSFRAVADQLGEWLPRL